MRVGLDIDNVITDFNKKILAEFYREDKNKRNQGIVNPNGKWIKDLFDWSNEEVEEFFNQNMQEFAKDLEPREGAKYYMDKLIEDGHQLYLISNRVYPHYTNPYEVTKKWLKEHNINYTKLILSQTTDKSKECLENNVDVMFDDSKSNCHKLEESGIKCYLMKTEYNYKDKEGLNIVNNWQELYEVVGNIPKKKVILDTDMFNGIDDQFALTYLIKSLGTFDLEAITIAPFSQSKYVNTTSIAEGTEKSYEVTLKILDMINKSEYKNIVYKGATKNYKDSKETNAAVEKIIEIAKKNDKTIILATGSITNIALAIEEYPKIINKIKIVWLGGNTFLTKDNSEFNFKQDIPAVQKVFNSKAELVVIPCKNVASNLSTTIYELKHYLNNDSKINKYLCDIFIKGEEKFITKHQDTIGYSKILWALSVIAYEINADWFKSEMISCPEVLNNGLYEQTEDKHNVIFVNYLYRDKIYHDFFIKMQKGEKQ